MQLERLTKITATKSSVEEGYTPDTDIVEVVKRLPGYLQPMVTLMASMVLPSEEGKCKRRVVGRLWLRLGVWCSW